MRISSSIILIIFMAAGLGLHSCGLFPDKKVTDNANTTPPTLGEHIPSDWDGTSDWQGSAWEVKEP